MDITFDKINTDIQSIVNFFEQLLANGDYDKAKDAVNAVASILNSPPNPIDLSDGNLIDPNDPSKGRKPDNNFHQLYLAFTKATTAKENDLNTAGTPIPSNFSDLKKTLDLVISKIFKTAEVKEVLINKDPSQQEFLDALQEAMDDEASVIEINEQIKYKYEAIEKELFFDKTTTPEMDRREAVKVSEKYKVALKNIKDSLDEIKRLRQWINSHPGSADATARSNYETQISSIKLSIEQSKIQLDSEGLNVSTLTNLTDEVNCVNSTIAQDSVQALMDKQNLEIEKQLEEIRKQLETAKSGMMVTVLDKDGNPIDIDIKDEEVILNLPDLSADLGSLSSTTNPTKEEQINKIKKSVADISVIKQQAVDQIDVSTEAIKSHSSQIAIIAKEIEILNRNLDDRQGFIDNMDDATKQKIEDEKKNRFEDARAKFYGDKNAKKKYNEAYKRFSDHKVQKTVKLKINGLELDVNYIGIDDTGEYANKAVKDNDLAFMQLESWEERNQRLSAANTFAEEAYRLKFEEERNNGKTDDECNKAATNARNEMLTKVYLYYDKLLKLEHDKALEELEQAQKDYNDVTKPGSTASDAVKENKRIQLENKQKEFGKILNTISGGYTRDKDYVENYNSSHFEMKDTVAILKTGGSAMMIKNHQDKPRFLDRVQAITKFSNPFSRKADGRTHWFSTTLGNIAGVTTLPLRMVEAGIGLAIAGVTYCVSQINGTYDRPTPYNVSWFDRKEARQEYYMNKGNNPFIAWVKSYFNLSAKDASGAVIVDPDTGKTRRVNDQLVYERCQQIGESIEDKYINGAKAQTINQREEALKNQRNRKAMVKEMIRKNPDLYTDIYESIEDTVNHPLYKDDGSLDDVAVNNIAKRIMARATAESDGVYDKNQTFAVYERDTDGVITKQRTKRTANLFNQKNASKKYKVSDIDDSYNYSKTYGDTLWTNAISRQNIGRGMTKGVDLAMRLSAASTIAVGKHLINNLVVNHSGKEVVTKDNWVEEKHPVYENGTKIVEKTVDEPISMDNLTVGDIQNATGNTASFTAFNGGNTVQLSPDANELQGFAIKFTDSSGKMVEYSVSDNTVNTFIQRNGLNRFSTSHTDFSDITDSTTFGDLLKKLPDNVRNQYENYLSSSGDFSKAFNDSFRIAKGVDLGDAEMPQGWLKTAIGTIKKTTTKTEEIPYTKFMGYEYKSVNYPVTEEVWKTVQNPILSGKSLTKIGLGSIVADIFRQALNPTFKKGKKNTTKSEKGKNEKYADRNSYDIYTKDLWDDFDGR